MSHNSGGTSLKTRVADSDLEQKHEHTATCSCGHDHSQDDHSHDHAAAHAHEHGESCSCGHDHSQDEHSHDHAVAHTHEHGESCSCGHDHSHDDHSHDHAAAHTHEHGESCSCGHDHSHDDHSHDHAHGQSAAPAMGASLDSSKDTLVFRISGLDCADCAEKLRQQVEKLPGVTAARLSFASAKLNVQGGQAESIIALVKDQGYTATQEATLNADGGRRAVLIVSGLDCAECAKGLQRQIQQMDGVIEAKMSFATAKMEVVFQQTSLAAIIERIESAGYSAVPQQTTLVKTEKRQWWKEKRNMLTIFSGITLAVGLLLHHTGFEAAAIPIFIVGMLGGGYYVARAGFTALSRGVMDMNFLMTVAAIGAAFIGQWEEAAAVVFLFSLGNAMQSFSMDHTRDSIRALMELAPHEATVLRNGKELTLPVETLDIGERILVRAGEKIPMDGVVVAGISSVDQAAITGESTPVDRETGDDVFAGTINLQGSLEVEVSKPYSESTVSRILHLVEEAQDQRAPSQQFVDKFAAIYTPIVILLAIGICLVPPLFMGQDFQVWFYRALQLLVISCPCALTISTPVSIVSAIGNASRRGVLIKGGAYLEAAGAAKVVAFDKTGTLTVGTPQVQQVVAGEGEDRQQLVQIAASLERLSTHPLAKAIVKLSQSENIATTEVEQFENHAGLGVSGYIDGRFYRVGGDRMLEEELNHTPELAEQMRRMKEAGMSLAYIADQEKIRGIIGLADRIRPESAAAIRALKADGVQQIALLTGDHAVPAKALAQSLDIDQVHAQLLPDEKLAKVRELEDRYGSVIMVGDGINDAPAMAAATVSIAMGVGGSDIALETADMALMSDDLSKVAWCISLSRKTLNIIRQNIVFSVVTKLIVLALAVAGMANLWLAVFADSGTALIVILNGMRLMKWDRKLPGGGIRETNERTERAVLAQD